MEENKCPNCSGKLELAPDRKKMICPYCGSEFKLDRDEVQEYKTGVFNRDWFEYEWDYDKLMSIDKCNTGITSMQRCLNEFNTSAEVEEYIRTYLMYSDDIAAPGIHEERLSGIKQRVSGNLEVGERIVIYYDDGLFMKGKTGVVVTDKRTLFVESRKISEIRHDAIPFIYFGYSLGLPEIKLGDKYVKNIGIFGSNYDTQGAVAALICMFSFENAPGRPKIRLTN